MLLSFLNGMDTLRGAGGLISSSGERGISNSFNRSYVYRCKSFHDQRISGVTTKLGCTRVHLLLVKDLHTEGKTCRFESYYLIESKATLGS